MDHLPKKKGRIQKFKETGDSRYIYQNELDKTCFQHYMAFGDFKDLTRKTVSDKILHVKHLVLLKIQSMVDIKGIWFRWFINFLIKMLLLRTPINLQVELTKNENMSKKELAEELYKSIIGKFRKRKVNSPFIAIFWSLICN